MSLIDPTYFIGPLTIAQIGQPAVEDNLNLFINRAEPEFLEAALGYDLWQDFMTGLQQPVIDQRWLNLRDGVTFTTVSSWPGWYWGIGWFNRYYWLNSQRSVHFAGFASPTSFSAPAGALSTITLISGNSPVGGVPNPIPGTNTYTYAGLANATFTIQRRNVGQLILGMDYALSNSNQTITLLKAGDVFGVGEIFIIQITQATQTGTPSNSYVSPIAGYVYYNWLRDQVTMNTGAGVVKSNIENATNANPAWRMYDAWKQMTKDIFIMWQFLEASYIADPTIYVSYDRTKIDYGFFAPINPYSI